MMISPKAVDAINDQIRNEFTASAQYIAIAVYFDEESLPDLAQFFMHCRLKKSAFTP